MIRKVAILFSGTAGILGAMKVVDYIAKQADPGARVDLFTGEGCLFAVPICIVGALIGVMLGGILFPATNR